MAQDFADFRTFYGFYLSEHRNRSNRRLHFVGSWL
ncbi:MAG: Mpo1-like protein, partial [Gammaproteobacteria bacterium]